ncbi:NADH dehydrogenase [ubiquinone] 1 alpha subcomplex subunit 8 [Copidosoma floridanum]|uniref:NADH dehydrogenase [ubiquinone] 1 alpha subcomplex subunit 8 n=1 Tax=Copidosoma floridanum TaxID=29053 RepID=UPI0006C9C1F5|nr:NADH dehydrogenase [ubiquinone] 1 alpha subcomplex subunit 8 [Copidosoma floridanum]
MVLTESIVLPSNEELNIQEINLTFSVLQAAAFHLGKYCESNNNEFMLCKSEEPDPRRCIDEGKSVTACALEFFKKIKKHCNEEFDQYYTCLEKSSGNSAFSPCRKTQSVFDQCVLDNLEIERPDFGYFCQVKIHNTQRPKPKSSIPVFPDAPVPITIEEPLPTPKYNSRRIYF